MFNQTKMAVNYLDCWKWVINIKMEPDQVACLENQCLGRLCRLLNNVINRQPKRDVSRQIVSEELINLSQ